jgi:succinate dehydrogenase/fumarate reductase cytochrome b subunit
VVYASFVVLTIKVITGKQGSQSGQQQDLTATVMQHQGGRWLVGIVGAIVVIAGLALVLQGLRHKFMKQLQTGQMNARTRRVVKWLGTIGTSARGVVFALVGILVIDAAATHNPAESGGVDKALQSLQHLPFGKVLLILAALGLAIFGVYGLCEARWRKV